jgi:hypothetical protein
MTAWSARASEERSLLNPSFGATLLWQAAFGHQTDPSAAGAGLPFETAFLILPMVLHREMRESLPRSVSTSLAVWTANIPLARSQIAARAHLLVPFTKDAMTFGGVRGGLSFSKGAMTANESWRKKLSMLLKECSDEVQECGHRAEFVGRWVARTGSADTVMSILGIRP